MKNLYKIEDELYIISNNESINENDHIITQDGRLVEVSYLLSKDVQGGHKVILTTNKLLIKDGVQAIDDEFLEWFVKNPSCEFVKLKSESSRKHGMWKPEYYPQIYKIIIPKEEPKPLFAKGQKVYLKEDNNVSQVVDDNTKDWSLWELLPKQETLEEVAANLADPNICKTDNWIAGAKWQAERSILIDKLLGNEDDSLDNFLLNSSEHTQEERELIMEAILVWFEQFKKK
jgi:hypothetical protein